jgi:hypothetical protein
MNASLFRLIAAAADPCAMNPTGCGSGDILGNIAKKVANGLFVALGIVCVFVAIYAGFLMMTSAGDAGKVAKGKKALLGAVIGLIISVCAYAIINFVMSNL